MLHNLVEEISGQPASFQVDHVLKTNLDAGTLLAQNHQTNGCIDGVYYFDDAERAKTFASICMDFVKKKIDGRLNQIDRLNYSEDYFAQHQSKPN